MKYVPIDSTEEDQEREFSRIFDIWYWTFERPMSKIENPAKFTLLWKPNLVHVLQD